MPGARSPLPIPVPAVPLRTVDGTGGQPSGQQHSAGAKKPKDEPVGTDTNDGSLGSGGQSGQQHSADAKKPKDEPVGTDTNDGSLGSGGQSGQQHSADAKKPKDEPVGTDTQDEEKGSGLTGTVPNVVVAPVTDVVAAPVTDVVGPVTNLVAPVSDVSALVQDMLTSVAGAVVPLTQLQSDLYSFLLGIAGVAPISDVSASIQDMLSSVVGAVVLLAQLPSDLFSFLLGIAGAPPVVGGVAGIHGPGLSAPAGASGASRLPLVLPFAGGSGVPVAGNATRVATLDVIALGRVSALSGMAPQAPNGAFPMGAESSFPHVFGEPLLIASLWALAAVALPGIGGLVILTVVGVRVQYGRLTPDSHREHRALRDSPIPRAVKRWMSAR